ncbi:MAG: RHS repeat-associated core domain-containing protein [Theionarchaea archaeon]|nr:RHS repeat-associated core domain-containing protein [Theionarchaea archaeon]
MGSTRLITDESGDVVTEAAYGPFGETTVTGEEEPFLYNGKERDSTGLYYYGARYYDLEIGRFITRDPKTGECHKPQTLNRYIYCLNNPMKYVDPMGLDPEDETDANELLELLKGILEDAGVEINNISEFLEAFLENLGQLLLDSDLFALVEPGAYETVVLMACYETVVELYGEELGITGAFLCFEGMASYGAGAQGGLALVFHPDLGWAAFAYGGYMLGAMFGTSVSLVAGFYKWNDPNGRDFTFRAWAGKFFSLEASGGFLFGLSGFYFEDYNTPARITGWGAGVGIGPPTPSGGVSAVVTWWKRIHSDSLPLWLRGIVVPDTQP